MRAAELVEGASYALRQRTRDGETLVEVSYVGPTRRREARVRYVGGADDGLVARVPVRLIVCAWAERGGLAQDEQRAGRLRQADAETWDPVADEAIAEVMAASGDYVGFSRRWTTDPATAQRFWRRGQLPGSPLDHHPSNFADRNGVWHLSFATALTAAQAFAAAEPDLVDLYLRGARDRLPSDGREENGEWFVRRLGPGHALARSWCREPRPGGPEQEVARLRSLVQQAVQLLHAAGDELGARRLGHALDSGGEGATSLLRSAREGETDG